MSGLTINVFFFSQTSQQSFFMFQRNEHVEMYKFSVSMVFGIHLAENDRLHILRYWQFILWGFSIIKCWIDSCVVVHICVPVKTAPQCYHQGLPPCVPINVRRWAVVFKCDSCSVTLFAMSILERVCLIVIFFTVLPMGNYLWFAFGHCLIKKYRSVNCACGNRITYPLTQNLFDQQKSFSLQDKLKFMEKPPPVILLLSYQ